MRTPVIAALATSLVLAACGGGSDDGAAPADPPADAPAESPAASADGDRVVATASGTTVDLDSFVGQDVMLWFWAPW